MIYIHANCQKPRKKLSVIRAELVSVKTARTVATGFATLLHEQNISQLSFFDHDMVELRAQLDDESARPKTILDG